MKELPRHPDDLGRVETPQPHIDWTEYFRKMGIQIPALPEPLHPLRDPQEFLSYPQAEDYPWLRVFSQMRDLLNGAVDSKGLLQPMLPSSPKVGADLSIPCFALAKEAQKTPAQIAEDVAVSLRSSDHGGLITQIEIAGGYVNVELNMDLIGAAVLDIVHTLGDDYGKTQNGRGETIVIDYSSPNIAKPMGVAHILSTSLGQALKNIYEADGYHVIGDNHLGDWGTQFGMLTLAHEMWGEEMIAKFPGDPVKALYEMYVRINKEAKNDPSFKERGRELFGKLEQGDIGAKELLQWATTSSLAEFQRIYDRLGTNLDYAIGESFYIGMVNSVVDAMKERGITRYGKTREEEAREKEEGIVIEVPDDVDGEGRPLVIRAEKGDPVMLLTTDGRSQYAARDIPALIARSAWFDPKEILYVVGADQGNYFNAVFAAFDALVGGNGPKVKHVEFGRMTFPGGEKMSSREGNILFLEDLLDGVRDKVLARLLFTKHRISEEFGMEEFENVVRFFPVDESDRILAEQIAVGAVVFANLQKGRERNIEFNIDKAINLEGNSGPYAQYAYARARSLLSKAEAEGVEIKYDSVHFGTKEEKDLIKLIAQYPTIIKKAREQNQPSIIAEYSLLLSGLFSTFYQKNHGIIHEEDDVVRSSRLRLTSAFSQTLKNALTLLAVPTPERI